MNCKSCASGYIFDEKTKKCLTTDESDQDGKYIENGELKDCYSTCRKCKGAGTSEKIIVLNVLIIIISIINTKEIV
jgi:hypothetical protein